MAHAQCIGTTTGRYGRPARASARISGSSPGPTGTPVMTSSGANAAPHPTHIELSIGWPGPSGPIFTLAGTSDRWNSKAGSI